MLLADAAAGYVEYLTADNCGLKYVREVDAFCAGDPAGPSFDPAAVVFLRDVVRGSGEQWEYLVEYVPLQGRLGCVFLRGVLFRVVSVMRRG